MTRKLLSIILLIVPSGFAFAQNFEIRANNPTAQPVNVINNRVNGFAEEPVTALFIKSTKPAEANTDFDLFSEGSKVKSFKGNGSTGALSLAGNKDMRNKRLEIKKGNNSEEKFIFVQQPVVMLRSTAGSDSLVFVNDTSTLEFPDAVNKINLRIKEPNADNIIYDVFVGDKKCGTVKADGTLQDVTCADITDIRNTAIEIRDNDGVVLGTYVIKGPKQNLTDEDDDTPNPPLRPLIEEVKSRFPQIAVTTYGLQVPTNNRHTAYSGPKFVHIFLDQFANNIFSTIPQGVANRQYVVHIFYMVDVTKANQVSYSVNQTAGEFQDAIVFNNAGQLGGLELRSAKEENLRWEHKEFLLSTSTTNITFEVIRTGLKSETTTKLEFETQTLKTYTIKMSKVYHGSFDIGLINSTLENPTFELVTSPTNANEKLVKKNEGSNRGVVTAMATFYTSPIILLESLFGAKEIPNYMLSGRNFLEDHKIYERIYPAIGVGFTDKTLNNLFFGFNWEFARGGSIFLGWHYGKVNVYNAPANFSFEQTPTTDAEFNLRKNTEWKTDFAIGLNVDIMIIRNLFRPATAGAGGE